MCFFFKQHEYKSTPGSDEVILRPETKTKIEKSMLEKNTIGRVLREKSDILSLHDRTVLTRVFKMQIFL